ncbi:unnamed protein product [Phyllotreta striolata]|uniref:Peptidase M14 domain-containing protein n=1 Tax=Phyllotreta striolata TaxID=444603 RepID=A0A9N9TXE4_PHYSR|nr:unnamed protein product [Phyllotreta striolata]
MRSYLDQTILLLIFSAVSGALSKLEFEYHTNEQMEEILKRFETIGNTKLTTRLYSIGISSSFQKPFPLWVLEITAAPENRTGVPNVKLLGNMHGNEAGGREILLHFIENLITLYDKDSRVTWLLKNTRLHIMPTLNPDGFSEASNSCHGSMGREVPSFMVDLNRNFPDFFHPNPELVHAEETIAVMNWMDKTKFILSAALHEGDMVANYPYDAINPNGFGAYLTPDDDVFKYLARVYADNHPVMHASKGCSNAGKDFKNGITNGADWYQFDGGMGDYNYNFHGCMEVTLELSCCKYPSNLTKLWSENEKSLLMYCMQANMGVTGLILDGTTRKPVEEEAMLRIEGRKLYFRSFQKTGEFWRILLPGKYILRVEVPGYYTHYENFTVEQPVNGFPKLTNLTILLVNASFPTTTTTTTTSSTTPTTTIRSKPSVAANLTARFGQNDGEKTDNVTWNEQVPILAASTSKSSRDLLLSELFLLIFITTFYLLL